MHKTAGKMDKMLEKWTKCWKHDKTCCKNEQNAGQMTTSAGHMNTML